MSTQTIPQPAGSPALHPTQPEQTAVPLLQARGIHKSFPAGAGQVEILHGIDLDLSAGETCAIMGPSGSGKSTLLACLSGLERPTQGSITLLGQDLAGQSRSALAKARRTSVGFVFQSYNILPALTGFENIALPYRLRRCAPPRSRIAQVMTALEIEHLADQRPSSMSGGEQQRVAIARVLTQAPRILFADEPTGALDSRSSARVLELLIAQASADAAPGEGQGRAVLMVTHDPAVAACCDRVVVLRDGLVVNTLHSPTTAQIGEVLATHTSEEVAS